MAKALRVDDVVPQADGTLSIHYTFGDPPLPLGWQGSGFSIGGLPDIETFIASYEGSLVDDPSKLLILLLARWQRVDSNLSNKAQIVGKTATFDPSTVAVLNVN